MAGNRCSRAVLGGLAAAGLFAAGCGGGGGKIVPVRAIAYLGVGASGRSAVYVARSDGSDRVRLTSERADIHSLRWSPDGSRLAFLNDLGVWVMDANGSHQRRLTRPEEVSASGPLAWSPNGKSIAFTRQTNVGNGVRDDLAIVTIGDGKLKILSSPGDSPAWSPDGGRLAFQRCIGSLAAKTFDCDLWVVNADGSNARALVRGPTQDGSPAWSPDGRRLAFTRSVDRTAYYELGIVSADGSRVRLLHSGPAVGAAPLWSPDGTRITFERNRGDTLPDLETWVVKADGSSGNRLLWKACGLNWSHDGTRIVFQRPCNFDFTTLWVSTPDGTGAKRIAEQAFEPHWRPPSPSHS